MHSEVALFHDLCDVFSIFDIRTTKILMLKHMVDDI